MKTNVIILAGVTASFSLIPQVSHAAIISGYGAYASTSTASNCPSYCTTAGGGDFQYDSDGVEFSTTASSSENSYATTRAFASLSDTSYLPTLRVETIAADNKGGNATAMAVQGYTYTGTDPFMFTLDYNLHGSTGANPTGSANDNTLRADVAVLIGSGLEWYPGFATLVYEVAYGFNEAGVDSLFLPTGTNQNVFGSISFELNTGDEFYVVASTSAHSVDGFADGWNTLSLSFADDTGLVAATAVSAVPVPAAVWLFGSGLLGLLTVARRRKV